jgi:methanogen homoaconitase large subunit
MAQTLAEKIVSHWSDRAVFAGDLTVAEVSMVMSHDSIAPNVIKVLTEDLEVQSVFDSQRVALFIDHVAPACNPSTADGQAIVRRFARDQGIDKLFDVGQGVCHELMVVEGFVRPGEIALGSDSHSTLYGAIGCFGTGMGATDIALAIATGRTWLRVPETIRVQIVGGLPDGVMSKDLALKLIGDLGIDGATYQAVEFHGAQSLSLASRMTLCAMTTEMGAKTGLVVPDALTGSLYDVPEWCHPDPGAAYITELEIDATSLAPQVACPHTVDLVVSVSELQEVEVDQVFIGTCTNGRLEDIHTAARILKGKRVAHGVRMLIIPASHGILKESLADGSMAVLLEAGATLGTPGCGPCIGRHMGVLGAGEVCLSTGNRNFQGRMGSPDAQIYLGSPAVAAATAVAGRISDPRAEL